MPKSIRVRAARREDANALTELRLALWPESGADEHAREVEEYFSNGWSSESAVLVADEGMGRSAIGFVELSIRPCAEGCVTRRIAYLEGWYVSPNCRRAGIGRALIEAAEEWGRLRGCVEFASDAAMDNDVSAAAHRSLGFHEVGLIRCFRKTI